MKKKEMVLREVFRDYRGPYKHVTYQPGKHKVDEPIFERAKKAGVLEDVATDAQGDNKSTEE